MARAPRLLRTVRMFVDVEDCGARCSISQVLVHVAQYEDGSCNAVISDATDPSRRVCHEKVNAGDLLKFLQVAKILNQLPTTS